MKHFTIKNNKWEIANIYNLTNSRQIKLYDYCEETNSMIWIGTGIY